MNERLQQILGHRLTVKVLSIAIAVTLVAGLSFVGPVGHRGPDAIDEGGSLVIDPTGAPSVSGTLPTTPGSTKGGAVPSNTQGGSGVVPGGFTIPGGGEPTIPPAGIPDFGLKTQGITADSVKVGISYNVAACGDAGVLQAMFANAAGDPKKAIEAYTQYVNDHGGIGGKRYESIIVDDGGSGCPEKNIAAAVQMGEQDKVFLAIPGLHIESDYIIDKYKIPVFGGREDPASLASYGANGIMLTEPAVPTFNAWASFGKHYLKTARHTPCLIRIESGAAGDFDTMERLLKQSMSAYGLSFGDRIYVFKDDVSTAQQQSDAIATEAQKAGCDQAYFMAGNNVGLIFITDAATQHNWFPKWTWTSATYGTDDDTLSQLMDQRQWENSVGLTTRVPAGEHRKQGNCKRIYEQYKGNDGMSDSAAAKIACAQILTTAAIMNRAIELTGTLNADTLLLGADSVDNDFYFDSTVPLDWRYPDADGPFKTRAFSHYTIADWDSNARKYTFPEYPCYYKLFAAHNGGCEDLRKTYAPK